MGAILRRTRSDSDCGTDGRVVVHWRAETTRPTSDYLRGFVPTFIQGILVEGGVIRRTTRNGGVGGVTTGGEELSGGSQQSRVWSSSRATCGGAAAADCTSRAQQPQPTGFV